VYLPRSLRRSLRLLTLQQAEGRSELGHLQLGLGLGCGCGFGFGIGFGFGFGFGCP
jgi:hypothetical protein